jgi:hypothetical protein
MYPVPSCYLSPLVRLLYFLGLIKQVVRPYVVSFALALHTLSLGIKKIVSVPFTRLGILCASCPRSLL